MLAQFVGYGKAIHVRHHDVEQHQIGQSFAVTISSAS